MESNQIWTVCYPAPLDARQVNPSPDGWTMIRPCPYTVEEVRDFQRQYDGGDPWGAQVVSRNVYIRQSDGSLIPDEGGEEDFFQSSDFVVSKDGKLLGFLVKENIVLWKGDFVPGGRFYDTDGVILRRWADRVECGYLTHSRW